MPPPITAILSRSIRRVLCATVEHQPVAGPEEPCICRAVTDAPLRFRGLIPRLAQPFLGI